jgi:hypothetical protein
MSMLRILGENLNDQDTKLFMHFQQFSFGYVFHAPTIDVDEDHNTS